MGTENSFKLMKLDDRILKSINDLGWSNPTPIQEKAIPLALEGKDIFVKARTGSGKTAIFLLPIIQRILEQKHTKSQHCQAFVIAPTKELCAQTTRHAKELSSCCSKEVVPLDISNQTEKVMLTSIKSISPDIVIGTPSKLLACIRAKAFPLLKDYLEYLVVDEADLVFSFGYEEDMKEILKLLPSTYQSFLTSATLNEEVKSLKKLVLNNPVSLKLEESEIPSSSQLMQYYIKCADEDKFVLIYSMLKLRLIRGKTIMFVNSVVRCYRLKLFLEQFGIMACILNSELPVNSRCHIVNEFNSGVYEYIIASDESDLVSGVPEDPSTSGDEKEKEAEPSKQRKPRKRLGNKKNEKSLNKQDKESGISRGIDFHNISNVINFDFPPTFDAYVHRIGRTARGWNKGTALSFASGDELKLLRKVVKRISLQIGSDAIKAYQFDLADLDGFRYRAMDAYKAVTNSAIREARLEEIKREIVTSKKLRTYFTDNPKDLALLRHDKALHTVKHQDHLKFVPDYIVPEALQGLNIAPKSKAKRRNRKRKASAPTIAQRKYQKKASDPLKSFDAGELDD